MLESIVSKEIFFGTILLDRSTKISIFVSFYVVTNFREKGHIADQVNG